MDAEPALPAEVATTSPRRRPHAGLRGTRHAPAVTGVALVTLYLSTQLLLQRHLFDFWSVADVALAWLDYLAELAWLAGAMVAAYVAVDAACRRRAVRRGWRLAAMAAALYGAAFLFVLAVAAWRNRLAVRPDVWLAATGALRWAVIAIYAVAVHAVWQRARKTDAQAGAAQAAAEALAAEHRLMRLQLLKAQIEPHFLFNTLANVRRLYRLEAGRGSRMMASLKLYLQAALPGVRRDDATLADELALVQAYLELIAVRMGERLRWCVDDLSGCADRLPFPPMVVLTLVENALHHGVEPSPAGGRVEVTARRAGGLLSIGVHDDGVGFAQAPTGGSGVGLANVRNQLMACYGPRARLRLTDARPGVLACIELDLAGHSG